MQLMPGKRRVNIIWAQAGRALIISIGATAQGKRVVSDPDKNVGLIRGIDIPVTKKNLV
jgi:hypothetical protein